MASSSRRSAIACLALVALTAMAGCTSPTALPVEPELPPLPPSRPEPIQFDCTHATLRASDACAGTSSQEGDQWAEPFVLAHPERDIYIIAAQGDASPAPQEGTPRVPLLDELGPTCGQRINCLFVTEDQGATWRRHPAVANDGTALYVDSSMAWSHDALLVAGLIPNSGGIGVLRSEDDGRSFAEAFIFSEVDSDDRPWIAARGREVALVWQESGEFQGFLRLSHDGGQSWDDALELPCNVFSRPVWSDAWWLACGSKAGSQVYRVQGEPELQAQFGDGGGTRMMARTASGFAMTTASAGVLRVSPDGINWGEPIDLLQETESSDSWIGWMGAYRDGAVALTWDTQGGCRFCADSNVARKLVNVDASLSIDSVDLTPTSGWAFDGPGPRAFGEFDGLDCGRLCLAAWPDEGRIAHVFFMP
jgi:hypothetical protein